MPMLRWTMTSSLSSPSTTTAYKLQRLTPARPKMSWPNCVMRSKPRSVSIPPILIPSDVLTDILSVAAGGTLPGATWPWKRLVKTMIQYMLITDSWPSTVFTPAQTNDALKGLAVLSPASRQVLLDDLRRRTPKNPFFKKIDTKTWNKCKFCYCSHFL